MLKKTISNLEYLESESIYIIREVVAETNNPVMLYSIGKDSSVLLHLAKKAFYPDNIPFPLLHIDTTWKFQDMYKLRDKISKNKNINLLIYKNKEALKKGINPFDHRELHTEKWKTEGLKNALEMYNFDAAIAGARRDEEKSRSKERIFSFRTKNHAWNPKNQRPEVWNIYNTFKHKGESIRVFPLSNWTEIDVWEYIKKEKIEISQLYFSANRLTVERNGLLFMIDDNRFRYNKDDNPRKRRIRFRTLGCYPLTAAIKSNAKKLSDVIKETILSQTSERKGRLVDKGENSSLEIKKRQGYF